MEKKAYSLRIFSFGYEFMQELRNEFKKRGNTYQYRFLNHPLNGQIDVQPIPIWFYPTLSGLIPNFSKRRLYLTVALEPFSPYLTYKVIVNLALDLNDQKLGVLAVMQVANKEITIMADTTTVTIGTHSIVAMRILAKLREHMEKNGFGEIKPYILGEDKKHYEENLELRENFFKKMI